MGQADRDGLVVADNGALVELDKDEEIAALRASIEVSRARVADAILDVQEQIEDKLVWRAWIEEHPYKTVGIAFGIGYLLGRI